MRCLSLIQPYATLIAAGCKKVETRSWSTKHRGELAIHASKNMPRAYREFCESDAVKCAIKVAVHPELIPVDTDGFYESWIYHQGLVLGSVLAICQLVDCVPTEEIRDTLSRNELELGNYNDGRYAWVLERVQPIGPFEAKGALGLWSWTPPGSS